ncbi:unnamed protein product [Orchesella dallaii]|uniref:MADF domain-containing protein n=1 Tax=Orchesella dallaii TaxID=48710 RepID=A0ABP1PVC9_9HEXA
MEEVETESQIIELVKEFKVLYDKSADGFKNKNKRQNAWSSIGSVLEIDSEQCKKMWDKLRSQYMGHKRKLLKRSGSATGTRPYFRHEAAMQFLSDSTMEENTYSNLEDTTNKADKEKNLNNQANQEEGEQGQEDAQNNEDHVVPRSSPSDFRTHKKFNGKRKLDAFDEEMLKLLKSSQNQDDEFKLFGDLVAANLRQLNATDPVKSRQLQLDIHSTINDARK